MFDFNDAETSSFELIPNNTIAPVIATLRPGASGPGGWLKASKSGESLMLDFEFVVTAGPYAKRKFFGNMVIEGSEKAVAITRGNLRAMLESARNIRPDDMSEAAQAGRRIANFGELDGLKFIAKIGIEKGTGEYKDKNKLIAAVTPDNKAFGEALKGGAAPVAQAGFTRPVAPSFAPDPAPRASSSTTTTSRSSNGAAPAWASR
jgi:hypothetical protein